MKKVLIINTTIDKGGAARVASEIFETRDENIEFYFAYGRKAKIDKKNTFYFGNRIEMFIHIFLVRFLGLEGFGSFFSTKKLIRYIEKENFDLINLHNLHGYYLNFSQLLSFLKRKQIPIVYSLHDEWPITWLPAHGLDCAHCKTGEGSCTNTYKYPKNYFPFFIKHMLKKKKVAFSGDLKMKIVCPSDWLTQNIKESFLGKFEIETIYNGIDTNIFYPRENKSQLREKYNLPIDKKIILFVASNLNDKSKGVRHIIEAAKILKDKNYLFLGLGNGNIHKDENIKIIPYLKDKNAVAEIYSLADVFCFASKAETFLLSAAEAMASGVPVVGFDIPVVKELVNENVGILTEQNSNSLAGKIDLILADQNLLQTMSESARKLIRENYSSDIFKAKYMAIYRGLIK